MLVNLQSALDPFPVFAAESSALFRSPSVRERKSRLLVEKGGWTVPGNRSQLHSGEVRRPNTKYT